MTHFQAILYLISSTFKDCSIFISLQRKSDDKQNAATIAPSNRVTEMQVDGATWLVKLSLVDFDPKPLGKIARYKKLHEDILSANGLKQSIILV